MILHGSGYDGIHGVGAKLYAREFIQTRHLYRLSVAYQRHPVGCEGKPDDGHRDRQKQKNMSVHGFPKYASILITNYSGVTRAFKYNSSKFEAFRSPNYPILAESGVHLKFSINDIRQPLEEGPFKVHKKLASDVAVLKLYPGIGPKVVENILAADVRGIVMETFGAGNTTTDKWFTDLLKKAIADGKVILDISQCKVGTVELGFPPLTKPARSL